MSAPQKPKKCRHTWRETRRYGNFWSGGLMIMEGCAKCTDVRTRPATNIEVKLAQEHYTCPICQQNHRPTNPLHEGCLVALVKRVHALEEAYADHRHSGDDGLVTGLP